MTEQLAEIVDHASNAQAETDPYAAASHLRNLRHTVADVEVNLVRLMRAGGHSWESIGDALGMSRQAAHERFNPSM